MCTHNVTKDSLYRIQWACFVCFAFTIIAVPTMLASRPDLRYYVINRANFSMVPTVEYHSETKAYTLLLLFLLPSTLEHLFAIVFPEKCISAIGWHRWISYVISAPSLIALVIYSTGPGAEIAVTILTVGLIVVCIGMGPIVEYATDIQNTFVFQMGIIVGFVALLFAFIPVWYYYDRANIPTNIEPYITAMVSIITALYWSFGFVPVYIYLGSSASDKYMQINIREILYCILSLVAKLPLAWLYAAMLVTRD